MNDKFESIWIDKIIRDSKDDIKNQYFSRFISIYDSLEAKDHYFVSFSKDKDKLSQWRGYADDGKGVAIGFSITLMPDLIYLYSKSQGVSELNGKTGITTSKIGYEYLIYNKNEQLNLIRQAFDNIKKFSDIEINAILLKELSTTFKHPSFKEEQEVRITYTPKNNENEQVDLILKKVSDKKYRAQNNTIIDFYKLGFNCEYNSLLVPEIIIGPKCKLDKAQLKCFLESNGFESTKVIYSDSSYR